MDNEQIDNMIIDLLALKKTLKEISEAQPVLQSEIQTEKTRVRGYKEQLREIQGDMMNYKGALRRHQDEIHVLYHKISVLLDNEKPDDYEKWSNDKKREWMRNYLDNEIPQDITFRGTNKRYTLLEYGHDPRVNPVSDYKEQALVFC